MEMEAFIRKTCKAVGERLGSGFHVEARDVRKNNGVILHGLMVSTIENVILLIAIAC